MTHYLSGAVPEYEICLGAAEFILINQDIVSRGISDPTAWNNHAG